MRIFILANGSATRWNNYLGVDKQLIVIQDEPIIHRTVRLLRENNQDDIYIIGKYEVEGAKNYMPPFESVIAKYDIFKELLDGVDSFIILYGDCYYTEAIIKDLVERPIDRYSHWACNRANELTGKVWEEGYAHKVTDVKWWLDKCEEYHNKIDTGEIEHKSDWVFVRFILDIELYEHHPELMKEHETDWQDVTDDFDYPIDYDNWTRTTGIK